MRAKGPFSNRREAITARQKYVSYLSTSELVRALEVAQDRVDGKLLTANPHTRLAWRGTLEDLTYELAGRQLQLWKDPTDEGPPTAT
jgi:hypothetical protein